MTTCMGWLRWGGECWIFILTDRCTYKSVRTWLTGGRLVKCPTSNQITDNYRKFNYSSSNNAERSFPENYTRVRNILSHPDLIDTELGVYVKDPSFVKYAACLANPWTAEPARIPTGAQVPSQVYRATINNQFTTSATTGFGFLAVRPVTSSDGQACIFSALSTSGATEVVQSTGTGITQGFFTQLPYTVAQHAKPAFGGNATSLASRVVACSVRIRNITPKINRGGTVRLGQTQLGNAAGVDFDQQQDLLVGNAYQFDGDMDGTSELRWQTSSINDLDFNTYYPGSAYRTVPFSTSAGGDPAVIDVNSMPLSTYCIVRAPNVSGTFQPQTFDFQVCIVVEYTGFVATGVPVSTSGARMGFPALGGLSQALTKAMNSGTVQPRKDSWWDWLLEKGKQGASYVGKELWDHKYDLLQMALTRGKSVPKLPMITTGKKSKKFTNSKGQSYTVVEPDD